MKVFAKIILTFFILTLIVASFQNCGGQQPGSGLNVGSSPSTSGPTSTVPGANTLPGNVQRIIIDPNKISSSNTNTGSKLSNAIDGDFSTTWNAGGPAPQWIMFDLGTAKNVVLINLQPNQFPATGPTTHEIWGGLTPASMTKISTISQTTTDGQWVSTVGLNANVQYLQIKTTSSPSWVSWYEIQVFGY